MKISCVWEHNGNDSILYADSFPGAFTRGASKEEAMLKMPEEIRRFRLWRHETALDDYGIEIVQEKASLIYRSEMQTAAFCSHRKKSLCVSKNTDISNPWP